MEQQVKNSKMMRQRKFLLVLPLLALPFMTMIFWALGGGKVQKAEARIQKQEGFNIKLPDAILKDDKPMDKMSYYDQAQQDSAKFMELVKNDPNYKNRTMTDTDDYLPEQYSSFQNPVNNKAVLNTSLYGSKDYSDPNTDKIYRKLADIDREISKPVATPTESDDYVYRRMPGRDNNKTIINPSDVDKLEQMMTMMNQPAGEDQELNQLDGMLDKILNVQHPELVSEKLRQISETQKGQVFAVSPQTEDNSITFMDTGHVVGNTTNRFYSFTDAKNSNGKQNAIPAVIHETQTIVDGSTVKLRLINDVFINGAHIPKDHFVFGIALVRGERLDIKINSIRYNNALFPVGLSVYDMDGLDGIYIPGAITRDVAKQSADRSMQTIGLTSLDPSLGAQAASAGIEAAKTLFSKKVKPVKVTVKAGYQVLLYDEKQNQSN